MATTSPNPKRTDNYFRRTHTQNQNPDLLILTASTEASVFIDLNNCTNFASLYCIQTPFAISSVSSLFVALDAMEDIGEKEWLHKSTAMKKPRTLSVGSDLGEDIVAWLSMEDSTVDELLKILDNEEEAALTATRVRFIDNPYSSSLIFQSSTSYVTINGNEESCGSSFSENDSSVMAYVDMGGIVDRVSDGAWFQGEKSGACESNELEEGYGCGNEGGFLVDGVDGGGGGRWEWDEEFLARFLQSEN